MTENVLANRIETLIAPTVEAMGFEVVRVAVIGADDIVLQIMAEPTDRPFMTVDDCADISRAVSAVLDVEDPITDAYTLEVSSPGLDRPLVKLKDFERFAGDEAKVELRMAVDGRRRFRGRLLGVEDEIVIMETGGERAELPFAEIAKAKLVVTDEMIAALEKEKTS